jgi:hypothetical protein
MVGLLDGGVANENSLKHVGPQSREEPHRKTSNE